MATEGTVFDIQRNSLNDGPGIRTTVFLKGCPLNCLWCHNEESIDPGPQLRYYPDKCTHCMECVKVCLPGAHTDAGGKHQLDFAACTTNWDCLEACVYGALARNGRTVGVEEIMRLVLRDVPYYQRSGGGLTISGGEPMVQPGFTLQLLHAARRNSIHTCLDTSGYTKTQKLLETIPVTDLYLYDFKESRSDLHQRFTGVGNEVILDNLKSLNAQGAAIILRCPVVPGLNDREAHFAEIARLGRELDGIREVHILPYHAMGRSKAAQLGRDTRQGSLREPRSEELTRWREILQDHQLKDFTIF